MYKSNKIWTHHDKPETYINVVKDNHGMVICFGNNIFSDEAWAPNSPEELYALLKTKCKDATIFAELKAIEQLANKHNVPMSEILFVDCSKPILTPRSVASIVRQAFGFNDTVTSMRTNQVYACQLQASTSLPTEESHLVATKFEVGRTSLPVVLGKDRIVFPIQALNGHDDGTKRRAASKALVFGNFVARRAKRHSPRRGDVARHVRRSVEARHLFRIMG